MIGWGVIKRAEVVVNIKSSVFLGRAIALPSIAFLGWLGWGLGATLLSHFIAGLLFHA
jgi:hypothetical protein